MKAKIETGRETTLHPDPYASSLVVAREDEAVIRALPTIRPEGRTWGSPLLHDFRLGRGKEIA